LVLRKIIFEIENEKCLFLAVSGIASGILDRLTRQILDGNFDNVAGGVLCCARGGMLGGTIGSLVALYIAEVFCCADNFGNFLLLFMVPVLAFALELSSARVNARKYIEQDEGLL
jgi:hypothetical protein